jgi:transposase
MPSDSRNSVQALAAGPIGPVRYVAYFRLSTERQGRSGLGLEAQREDTLGVPPLIEGAFGALLGDRAFNTDWLRAEHDARSAAAVTPPKANASFDSGMYRWRHLIENTFATLKEFRAVATRYDKTDTSYTATIHLADCGHRFTLYVNRR